MLRHLMYKIKSTGPITVAEYMKEVLTNPAKVWVGEPGDQDRSSCAAGCEPGGYAQRGPRRSSALAVAFQGKSHAQRPGGR